MVHSTVEIPGATDRFAMVYASADGKLCGAVTVNWPKASITLRRDLAGKPTFADALRRIVDLQAGQGGFRPSLSPARPEHCPS